MDHLPAEPVGGPRRTGPVRHACGSVRSIDYAFDDDQAPSGAVVSVKPRLSTEDSFFYLTIELSYADGQWRVDWAGLEK